MQAVPHARTMPATLLIALKGTEAASSQLRLAGINAISDVRAMLYSRQLPGREGRVRQ